MKKAIIPTFIVLACFAVLFLQPVRLISEDSTRIHLHIGKTIPLVTISDVAGGHRCYVDEDSYFWLSNDECVVKNSNRMAAKFQLRDLTILYREAP